MTGKQMNWVKAFISDERGATAIEYGLIAAGLSIVVTGAVAIVGEALNTALFGKVAAALGL